MRMLKFVSVIALAITFNIVGFIPAVVELGVSQAFACTKTVGVDCNRSSDVVTFTGDKILTDQIKVTVCHTYWDRLNVGTYNGRQTKWWAPIMVYGQWYGDLPVVTDQCHTYWVKPGTEMKLYASCVQRVIATGAMRQSGTYYLN